MNLPEKFTEKMRGLLGDEYESFLKSYEEGRNFGLRVNTAKISPEEFQKIAPFHLKRIPWVENGFYYEEQDRPARHPFYYAGLYYLQEPSAMSPASRLEIERGDKVLDLCAAPGGKATELGAKLRGEGLLVANDISASRARALLKNVEIFGIPNAFLINEVPAKIADQFEEFFDKILVDAPCSGEGMFRKDPDVAKVWSQEKSLECSRIQKDIILSAAKMLAPGGMMLYSTCTFSPEENEEAVSYTHLDVYKRQEVNSLSEAQTEQAYLAVYYDHPELFWLTSGYQYWTDSEESVTGIEMEYNSTWEEKEEQSRQIEAAIQEVLYEIDYGQDTYGKIKSAYEYLINRIDYVADSPYNQDIRSVFLNWQSVCTGYTKAMQVLLERMGIFCTCVRGTANGGHHAWNLVQIDGEYYYVDATWGDPVYLGEEDISSDIDYTYLCCTEEVLFRTHTPEDMAILPECSSELYNYYALNGMYLYSGDRDSIYNLSLIHI